jgi:hypothetical protein
LLLHCKCFAFLSIIIALYLVYGLVVNSITPSINVKWITNYRNGYWLVISVPPYYLGFSEYFTIKNSTALHAISSSSSSIPSGASFTSAASQTASFSGQPEISTSSSSSLSTGVKAGIAVSATLGAVLIFTICIFLYWRRRRRPSSAELSATAEIISRNDSTTYRQPELEGDHSWGGPFDYRGKPELAVEEATAGSGLGGGAGRETTNAVTASPHLLATNTGASSGHSASNNAEVLPFGLTSTDKELVDPLNPVIHLLPTPTAFPAPETEATAPKYVVSPLRTATTSLEALRSQANHLAFEIAGHENLQRLRVQQAELLDRIRELEQELAAGSGQRRAT